MVRCGTSIPGMHYMNVFISMDIFQYMYSICPSCDIGRVHVSISTDTETGGLYRNRARRQSGFPTFISCQRQDVNVLPKRRQSHQGDKLCDVSTVALVARWPVFLARISDADGERH